MDLINNKELSIDCFVNVDKAENKILIQSIIKISGMPFSVSVIF